MAFLRPNADDVDGNWLNAAGNNTNLYDSLDETIAGDTDYIVSPANPVNEICRVALSNPTGSMGAPFILRYRFNNIGGATLRVRLVQGASTEIAAWDESGVGWTTSAQPLTAPQLALITDFNDLFVEFTATTITLPFPSANLTAWFDGDEFTGQANGTAIATWTDAKGAHHAVQATSGQRPTVDATGLNSMAVLLFDGADDFFPLPDFVSAYAAGSAFFVAKNNSIPQAAAQDSCPLSDFGTDAPSGDHWPYTNDGNIYNDFGATVRKTCGTPPISLATWHIGNLNSAANDWSCFINGTSLFATATNTVGFNTMPRIARCVVGTSFFAGRIAEILIFNAVLGTSDRQKVEGYLAHRWGITSVLDSGHPYKSSPP